MIGIEEIILFAFAGFWISWVAVRREQPGKRLIRFCEGPLMSFSNFIDRNVMRIADFFVWFSRNPLVALEIMKDTMSINLRRPFTPPDRMMEYEKDLEKEEKRYPGRLPRWAVGAGVMLILIFFSFYLVLMCLSMV
jgi:hypothetical protein